MRYDVSLHIDTGNRLVEIVYIGNYTYNVSNMYAKCLGKSLSDFHRAIAESLINILKKGIRDMVINKKEYELLNPPNGWGNYEGALGFLKDILNACEEHPKTIIYIY